MTGVPWWGAIAIAAGATLLGAVLDSFRGDELTSVFSVFYVLGCIAAIVAVQHRGVFTAMAQPPLLLVAAIPLTQELFFASSVSGLRDLALNVAYPLVNRFPAMLVATAAVLVIGGVRIYLAQQEDTSARPGRGAGRRTRSPSANAAAKKGRPATRAPGRGSSTGGDRTDDTPARSRVAAGQTRTQRQNRAQQTPAGSRREREPESTKTSVRQVSAGWDDPAARRNQDDADPPRRSEPVSRRAPSPRRRDVDAQPQRRPRVSAPAYPPPAVRYRDRHED